MGKLRFEPRQKPPVTGEEYGYYRRLLANARSASSGNHVFYDLDGEERAARVRAAIRYVASAEGIEVIVRVHRKQRNLSIRFPVRKAGNGRKARPARRLSPAEARQQILKVLRASQRPLLKAEILAQTRVSMTTWNLRVNELLDAGFIRRHGGGPSTSYSILDG